VSTGGFRIPDRGPNATEAAHAEVFRRVMPEANETLRQTFRRTVERQTERWAREAEYTKLGTEALLDVLAKDERHRTGLELFQRDAERTMTLTERHEHEHGHETESGRFALRPWLLDPLDNAADIVASAGPDKKLDVFGPPYAQQWSDQHGDRPHQQQMILLNANTGRFGFVHTIGKEGGNIFSGAAHWIQFMPTPGMTQAEVRPYCPFNYAWHDKSYIATAHNHGGFGILVLSFDLSGGDRATEQDFRYELWGDGTSWYQDHANPSFPAHDDDNAYLWGHEAPYFNLRQNRIYMAAIWCWGNCDANGASLTEASYAQALIDARIPFVVVGSR
jgi:hypothetical protein